jgi:hypothetical protein
MNSVEFTLLDIAAIAINIAVAYLVTLRAPQPAAVIIPLLAVTSVATGILLNRVKAPNSSAALTEFRSILHLISFVGYVAILLMRFSIIETVGFVIVTGLLTGLFFLLTNLTLNKLESK